MSYSFQNVKPRMIYTFFASRDEISIMPFIKIYPIYYQAVHFFNLFWGFLTTSHYKCSSGLTSNSDIEHFYFKIKRGFRPCYHGLHGGCRRVAGLSSPVKYIYWPFQGGTSFVFFFCHVFVMLSSVCLLMPCSHLLGKG